MSSPDPVEPSLADPKPGAIGCARWALWSIRTDTARVTGGGRHPIVRNCGCNGETHGHHVGIGAGYESAA
jgi:hypothetical protein